MYSGGGGRRIMSLRPAQAKAMRPCLKKKKQKGWGKAQVVEHFLSMPWFQSLIPEREREREKKREREREKFTDQACYEGMNSNRKV
jgi:hypothetical protein